jgi:hypothetical protein
MGAQGEVARSVADIAVGDGLSVELADGAVDATATDVRPSQEASGANGRADVVPGGRRDS